MSAEVQRDPVRPSQPQEGKSVCKYLSCSTTECCVQKRVYISLTAEAYKTLKAQISFLFAHYSLKRVKASGKRAVG